jgi:hypothetical protein
MENIILNLVNDKTDEQLCEIELDEKTHTALLEYALIDILHNAIYKENKNKYHGITYGIPCWKPILWLWKNICCRFNWHLFDEVLSSLDEYNHYLHCDACELIVHISRIEKEDGK